MTTATLWKLMTAKLRGHYNYYGVTFNEAKLSHFYHGCIGAVFRWLSSTTDPPLRVLSFVNDMTATRETNPKRSGAPGPGVRA